MRKYYIFLLIIFTVLLGIQQCRNASNQDVTWKLYIHEQCGEKLLVTEIPTSAKRLRDNNFKVKDYQVKLRIAPKNEYLAFEASITSIEPAEIFLSLECHYDTAIFTPYNYTGRVDSAEIFRQSPHDVNAWIVKTIAMQAMPVVAIKSNTTFHVALSDAPFRYHNFTTQAFFPKQGLISLNSGDNAKTPGIQPEMSEELDLDYNADKTQRFSPGKVLPYYHPIGKQIAHTFSGIIFSANSQNLNALRKDITTRSADYFSDGKYTDYFGALAFTSAYFNLRTNDSGKSKYWVIPAVEYGNTQYGRDAFWIATMLPSEYAAECIKSELAEVNHFAEYPLFAIIWSYRAIAQGFDIDLEKVQRYVDAVENRAHDNRYYSYWEGDGRLDFQYWGDVIAFEKDDVIAYNQGLFAIAIRMAKNLGLSINSDPEKAESAYRDFFNKEYGFFPVSQRKLILSPDAIVPDLISMIYLDRPMLDSERVRMHFESVTKYAKTPYGFKIVSTPTGEYLPDEMYDIPGYQSQVNREKMPDGRYFKGGSYFLYDNLFLITAYLHGVSEAEELLKWRVGLDFKIGATTYETLNTITGEPWKPNMGWNVAVYAFWKKLLDDGLADEGLFNYVDSIVIDEKNK